MMDIENIILRIRKKFTTVSSFCRSSGFSLRTMQIIIYGERRYPNMSQYRNDLLKEVLELIKETDPNKDGNRLTSKMRALIGKAIVDQGGVYKFCDKNPQFNKTSIFQMLDGRRKNRSNKVNDLIEFLGIE